MLRLYFIVARSRPQAFSGVASITIADIESVYRLCDVVELMPAEDFIHWMFLLDAELKEWYSERNPDK